ncbi:hypothetical protein [Actinophytocola sp. NPDC049390]|uniref:hypothetical protein n=1 Tax=Actinophytocola sp. NPDC049390 TaxID=3363894 RepID=UPI003792CEE5
MTTAMPAMYSPPTQRAVDHLVELGFTITANGRDFTHPRAVVRLIDDGAACFIVRPVRHGDPYYDFWEAQLTRAPMDVFAAAVAAAIRED